KRGLARSVRSDDAENRAFADREADILHGAQAAERFRDPARLQDDLAAAWIRRPQERWHRVRDDSGGAGSDGPAARAEEGANLPEDAFGGDEDHGDDGDAEDHPLDAGKAGAELGVQNLRDR